MNITLNQLQAAVGRLYQERDYTYDLPTLGLGLCEEAGEVAGAINNRNALYKQKDGRSTDSLEHELGDTLKYLCAIANSAGLVLADCIQDLHEDIEEQDRIDRIARETLGIGNNEKAAGGEGNEK